MLKEWNDNFNMFFKVNLGVYVKWKYPSKNESNIKTYFYKSIENLFPAYLNYKKCWSSSTE